MPSWARLAMSFPVPNRRVITTAATLSQLRQQRSHHIINHNHIVRVDFPMITTITQLDPRMALVCQRILSTRMFLCHRLTIPTTTKVWILSSCVAPWPVSCGRNCAPMTPIITANSVCSRTTSYPRRGCSGKWRLNLAPHTPRQAMAPCRISCVPSCLPATRAAITACPCPRQVPPIPSTSSIVQRILVTSPSIASPQR